MQLLHVYTLLAVLRIAGSLPISPTPCAASFPGHIETDVLPISDASSRCTSLPSPSPGLIVSSLVLFDLIQAPLFPLEGLSHSSEPFFSVCQEHAVASSSQDTPLLVHHSMFSASCSALLCQLINVGME